MKLLTKVSKGFAVFLSLFVILAPTVQAEDIIISDNGASSGNTVVVETTTTTNVSQSNVASIDNTVSVSNTTGNNQADSNTGNTTIVTGDSTSQIAVSNQTNTSHASVDSCCSESTSSFTVQGNGANSINTIGVANTQNTSVAVSQTATINNTITGSANTGGNSASLDTGDVTIATGDIKVLGSVKNGPVNTNTTNVGVSSDPSLAIAVLTNSANSQNILDLSFSNLGTTVVNNQANLFNSLFWDLNTGRNKADLNTGAIAMSTGAIDFSFSIENGPINSSNTNMSCCSQLPDDDLDVDGEDDSKPGNGGNGGGGGGSNGGGSSAGGSSETRVAAMDILGLSDTSGSGQARTFLIGLAMFLAGISLFVRRFGPKTICLSIVCQY